MGLCYNSGIQFYCNMFWKNIFRKVFYYKYIEKYAWVWNLGTCLWFHTLNSNIKKNGWNVSVINSNTRTWLNFSTYNRGKKAMYPSECIWYISKSCMSSATIFFCIKINPGVNEIRGKINEILIENIAIHISVRFNILPYKNYNLFTAVIRMLWKAVPYIYTCVFH